MRVIPVFSINGKGDTNADVFVALLARPRNRVSTSYGEMLRTVPAIQKLNEAARHAGSDVALTDSEWAELYERVTADDAGFAENSPTNMAVIESVINASEVA